MPQLPKTRLAQSRSRSAPKPTQLDKFIENPAHTQTLGLGQTASEGSLESTVAFWRSNSRIRDSKVAPVILPVRSEPFDGLPLLSLPTQKRHVTDNLQSHAPPAPPAGKEYILEPEQFAFAFVEPPKYRLVNKQSSPGTLQAPSERQQRALQEKLTQQAAKQLHSDNSKETRLKAKMLWEFGRGALNAESVSTEGSEIYHDAQASISDMEWHKRQRRDIKMGNLVNNDRGNFNRLIKYDPLVDGDAKDKWFQAKSRVEGQSSFTQSTKTHDVRDVPPQRTVDIRNCLTKGRQYNILSGAQLEDIPPTIPESNEAKALRAIHPSINQHDSSAYRIGFL